MSESKMLKARCTKTGRAYGLELKKYGADWKVVNMIDLSSEEAGILPPKLYNQYPKICVLTPFAIN